MRRFQNVLLFFFAMYGIATVLGFTTFLLISPTAMWIAVFTVMPAVATLLICGYLRWLGCPSGQCRRETAVVVAIWIALSFLLDAATYILVVPAFAHRPRNTTFFIDQSPWIWLSYAVLIGCGFAAERLYRWQISR
jgi:hypothetical protein